MDSFFKGAGFIDGKITLLSPREAFQFLQKGAALVDIRAAYETNFRLFDVPKIYYLPKEDFQEHYSAISREEPLIVADNVGTRSKDIARFLAANGYSSVACLIGGVVAWAKDGLPLTVDRDFELVGQCSCKLKPRKPRKDQ